jgi:Terminase RNaseH-like domain
VIEDAASGQSLIQELRRGTGLPLRPVTADRDKYTRATGVTPTVERGQLLLPVDAGWLEDFKRELLAFPGAPHDDLVDATVYALIWLGEHGGSNVGDYNFAAAAAESVASALGSTHATYQPESYLEAHERKNIELAAGYCSDCGVSLVGRTRWNDGQFHCRPDPKHPDPCPTPDSNMFCRHCGRQKASPQASCNRCGW